MRCWRQTAACAMAVCVLGALVTARAAGVRWNNTASMPRGFWAVAPAAGAVRRGQTVTACPPDTMAIHEALLRGYLAVGDCPGGLEPLLKIAASVVGDVVTVTPAGLMVNAEPIKNTLHLDLA